MIAEFKAAFFIFGVLSFCVFFPTMCALILASVLDADFPIAFLETFFLGGLFYLLVGGFLVPIVGILFWLVDRSLNF